MVFLITEPTLQPLGFFVCWLTRSHYNSQTDLELAILLPWPLAFCKFLYIQALPSLYPLTVVGFLILFFPWGFLFVFLSKTFPQSHPRVDFLNIWTLYPSSCSLPFLLKSCQPCTAAVKRVPPITAQCASLWAYTVYANIFRVDSLLYILRLFQILSSLSHTPHLPSKTPSNHPGFNFSLCLPPSIHPLFHLVR